MQKLINVKNAEDFHDTQAEVIVENKIDYVPKVSVIIPVYNAEKYLRECLDSVIHQTLKEIEIICIDDGSTDNSLDILKEYAEKDNRFTILKQQNLYAGVARNAGLTVAKGKYIHFLDSDDWIDSDTYDDLYKKIKEIKTDLIKFKSYSFDDVNKKILSSYFTNMGAVKEKYFNKVLCCCKIYPTLVNVSDAPWSGIYKLDFIKKNRCYFDSLRCSNDVGFYYRCFTRLKKIYLYDKRFVYYRINNASSLIGIRAYNFHNQLQCYRNILKVICNLSDEKQNIVKTHLLHSIFYRYNNYINNNNLDESAKKQLLDQMKSFLQSINKNLIEKENIGQYLDIRNIPRISIIIPVYNAEKYLRECLDSVVNQTLKNIEIICIDDASTDGSLKILEEYANNDKRIKIIKNQSNTGAPGTVKNIGIKEAIGEYIGFVDSDDWIDSDYFEKLYSVAVNDNADMASALTIIRFNTSKETKSVYNVGGKKTLVTIDEKLPLIEKAGANWIKLFKTDFIHKYKLKCWEFRCIAEDNYLSSISMLLANKISIESSVAYHYRKDANSLTDHKRTNKDFNIFDVYSAILKHIRQSDVKNKKQMIKAVEKRIIQDFVWFRNDIDIRYLDEFKEKLRMIFPKLYKKVFPCDNVVVSLTSYPARINTVHRAIESLLNQSMKADKVVLWLAPEQFPNKEDDLPKQLLDLKEKGLVIDWYHDIKSYKKLIPTLKKFPNAIIVTADDDNIYGKCWLEKLYNNYLKYPKDIQCHRVTKFIIGNTNEFEIIAGGQSYYKNASYLNKLVGLGGVLYPPRCFSSDILNENLIMKLAPTNDDQWFWFQAMMKGRKVRVVDNPEIKANYIPGTQECGLSRNVNDHGEKRFWIDFNNLINYYPKAKHLLKKEWKMVNNVRNTFFENLFSVKNSLTKKHKVVTILGIRISIRRKLLHHLFSISNKQSLNGKCHKVIYILGIKISLRNKRKEKRFAIEQEKKFIHNSLNNLVRQNKELKKQNEELKKEIKIQREYGIQQRECLRREFRYKLHKYCSPEMRPIALQDWYYSVTKKDLNLENPQTFNEKIQWLKLYDSTPMKTRLADKYLVRDWIKEKIGEEYLIPLLGVWDKFDDIDFDKLPNQFVLKCNHGSGYNIIVTDKSKLDLADAKRKIDTWMQEDFAFHAGFEMHYSAIPHKIIAEEYIKTSTGDLQDYKFLCIHGNIEIIWVDKDRYSNHKRNLYDLNWNLLDKKINTSYDNFENCEKPKNFEKMKEFAKLFSQDFPVVRVDFYENNGQLFFGEMTFTSSSGTEDMYPASLNYELGKLIHLGEKDKRWVR